MKKYNRLLSVVLAVFMLFSLSACGGDGGSSGDGSEVVMRYGDYTLSEKDYMYIISSFKSQLVEYYQTSFAQYGMTYEEADILAMQMDEDTTIAQYIEELSLEFAQQMLIFEKLCADVNISISDQSDIDTINGHLDDIVYAYGGEDLFEIEMARIGIAKSSIERYLRANVYYELIHEYRYGDNGIAAIPAETVYAEFLENYLRYDGALFSYGDYSTGEAYTFEYADEEIAAYFDTEFVKVRHILYKTVNSSNQKLEEDKIAEKKAKAEASLEAILNGEKTLDDLKEETEDSGYEYIFTYDQMVDNFETAAFEMEIGEVRLVETEYGYHIIEKLAKTAEDLSGVTDEEGKTEGGCKDDVISAMSVAQIRSEALELLAKLQSGEVKEYPEEDSDKAYYLPMEASLINKNESNYATFIEMLSEIEEGKFAEKNFVGDASYVIRRLSLTSEDITADIYASIEDSLALTAFGEYVQSFYDKIEINNELIEKFDVITVPTLDSELYTFG